MMCVFNIKLDSNQTVWYCSSVRRKVWALKRWATRVSLRWRNRHKWLRNWGRSRLPRPKNKLRSPCKNTHAFGFSERKMWWKWNVSLWLFQCGLDASGLQRARDRQKDGGEEASQPGGQEKGTGWETGNGPGNPEVATWHKTVVVTRNSWLG